MLLAWCLTLALPSLNTATAARAHLSSVGALYPATPVERAARGRRVFVDAALSGVLLSLAATLPSNAVTVQNSPNAWVPTGDPKDPASYYEQLRAGRSEMQRCLDDWVTLTHADRETDFDGDAVRRIIGTVGTGSPLMRIDKVFDKLRIACFDDPRFADVDVERLVELAEGTVQGLRDTDYLAYSAIFADPSGNAGVPGKSSKDYLAKTRFELKATLGKYDKLLKLFKL
jgi:hypothetical protein